MKQCYICGGKMVESVDLVVSNGKSIPQQVQICSKCGKTIVHIDEYNKVRKELHPSFFDRVRGIFSKKIEIVDIFKGKVL